MAQEYLLSPLLFSKDNSHLIEHYLNFNRNITNDSSDKSEAVALAPQYYEFYLPALGEVLDDYGQAPSLRLLLKASDHYFKNYALSPWRSDDMGANQANNSNSLCKEQGLNLHQTTKDCTSITPNFSYEPDVSIDQHLYYYAQVQCYHESSVKEFTYSTTPELSWVYYVGDNSCLEVRVDGRKIEGSFAYLNTNEAYLATELIKIGKTNSVGAYQELLDQYLKQSNLDNSYYTEIGDITDSLEHGDVCGTCGISPDNTNLDPSLGEDDHNLAHSCALVCNQSNNTMGYKFNYAHSMSIKMQGIKYLNRQGRMMNRHYTNVLLIGYSAVEDSFYQAKLLGSIGNTSSSNYHSKDKSREVMTQALVRKAGAFSAMVPESISFAFKSSVLLNTKVRHIQSNMSMLERLESSDLLVKLRFLGTDHHEPLRGHYSLSSLYHNNEHLNVSSLAKNRFSPYIPITYQDNIPIFMLPRKCYWGSYDAFKLYSYLGRFLNADTLILKDVMVGSQYVPLVIGSPTGQVLLTLLCSGTKESLLDAKHKDSNLLAYLLKGSRAAQQLTKYWQQTLLVNEDKSRCELIASFVYQGIIFDNCPIDDLTLELEQRLDRAYQELAMLQEQLSEVTKRCVHYDELYRDFDFELYRPLYEPYVGQDHLPEALSEEILALVQLHVLKEQCAQEHDDKKQEYDFYLQIAKILSSMDENNICISEVDPYTLAEFLRAQHSQPMYELSLCLSPEHEDSIKEEPSVHLYDLTDVSHDKDYGAMAMACWGQDEFSLSIDKLPERLKLDNAQSLYFYDRSWSTLGEHYLQERYNCALGKSSAWNSEFQDTIDDLSKKLVPLYPYEQVDHSSWNDPNTKWLPLVPFNCDFRRSGFIKDHHDEQYLFNMLGLKNTVELDSTLVLGLLAMLKGLAHDCYPKHGTIRAIVLQKHYKQQALDCARDLVRSHYHKLLKQVSALSSGEMLLRNHAKTVSNDILSQAQAQLACLSGTYWAQRAHEDAMGLKEQERHNQKIAALCSKHLKKLGEAYLMSQAQKHSLGAAIIENEHLMRNVNLDYDLIKASLISPELPYADGTWAQSLDFLGQDSLNFKYYYVEDKYHIGSLSYEQIFEYEHQFLKLQAQYYDSIAKAQEQDPKELLVGHLDQAFEQHKKRKRKQK